MCIPEELKKFIIVIAIKRTMLMRACGGIETLAVGSSHGDFGFNPIFCVNSFNMCVRSMDLKYSYYMYKKISQNNPDIKKLVLFYSVFSSGFFLEESPSESPIGLVLNELFHLGVEYQNEPLKSLSLALRGKLEDISINGWGFNGFLPLTEKGFFPAAYGADRRAGDHLKLNKNTGAISWLGPIIQLARKLNHKIYIVIPPVRSDYRVACGGNFSEIFSSLLGGLKKYDTDNRTKIINLFDDNRFVDDYFGDYDHLLPLGEGARILSCDVGRITGGA